MSGQTLVALIGCGLFAAVLIGLFVIETVEVRRHRQAVRRFEKRIYPDVSWRVEQLTTPLGVTRPDPHGRVLQRGRGYWQ